MSVVIDLACLYKYIMTWPHIPSHALNVDATHTHETWAYLLQIGLYLVNSLAGLYHLCLTSDLIK
jgi:hypothetical protein